jgi:integrating conjugative element membrane protein (TIGR03747 family)
MANPAQSAQAQQQRVREKGPILRTLYPICIHRPAAGLAVYQRTVRMDRFVLLLARTGWHHARDMLNNELRWIAKGFAKSLVVDDPGRTAKEVIDLAYKWIFDETGLIEWINCSAVQSRINSGQARGAQQCLGIIYVALEDYGLAAVYAVLTFLTRLLILTLSIPLFVMAAFTGAVDGLVRRDLRRFGSGRESGFIYHRAMMLMVPAGVAPWVIYLAMPVSVNPMLILRLSAAILGMVVNTILRESNILGISISS